jgi:NADP-dependent alcohol dehydrogenase
MQNFTYYNPVKLVFGKGAIAQLAQLVPADAKALMAYGGGSIMKNGVYEQVVKALAGREVVEFGGIEPNPRYETLMKAVEIVRAEEIDFILAVGGGSVLDGVKFIAAAAPFEAGDPWGILSENAPFSKAIALGSVLTLPATGSEMNCFSVISRDSTSEKFAFGNPLVFPTFSILDPETTYSLPPRQVANGIVDAFAHTMEQYMTFPASALIQDRWAESILSTLIELGPEVMASNDDYDSRANFMWTATVALNGIIGVGVPQDWATHGIGHEITALYGLDHAQTLAVVMPALFRVRKDQKRAKLLQYAARVWGITEGNEDERIEAAIAKTEAFFRSLAVKTRLAEYGVTEGVERIPARFAERGTKLGERGDIDSTEVAKILELCAK